MTREETADAQRVLMDLRQASEGALIVGFGAYAPNRETPSGSVSVTVSAAGYSATSEAVHLSDAIYMARYKLAKEAKERADEAAGKPRKSKRNQAVGA